MNQPEIKPSLKTSPGTGLMRHTLTVTVLSHADVVDVNSLMMGNGIQALVAPEADVVLDVDWTDGESLTHQEMAKAIRDAGSEPGYLLGEYAWVYELSPNDEVTVNGFTGHIASIAFSDDGETAAIQFMGGHLVSCAVEDIS